MATDPFADVAGLPGVAEAVARARAAVDELLWPRTLGDHGPALARASRVHSAQACAAFEGVDFAVQAWWSGDVWEDSPMGHAAAGVWRGYRELPQLVDVWRSAPLQALARLHALAAADLEPAADLGRPRTSPPDDPLRLGPAPDEVGARLSLLGRLVGRGTAAPAVVEAAAVHGELLALRPFATGSGAIALMAQRLVLAARGLDPDMLTAPEVALMRAGRPAYVTAAKGFISGTSTGVAEWICFIAGTVAQGAEVGRQLLEEIRAEPLGKPGQPE